MAQKLYYLRLRDNPKEVTMRHLFKLLTIFTLLGVVGINIQSMESRLELNQNVQCSSKKGLHYVTNLKGEQVGERGYPNKTECLNQISQSTNQHFCAQNRKGHFYKVNLETKNRGSRKYSSLSSCLQTI